MFFSYHWSWEELGDPELDAGRHELANPTSAEATRRAFRTLLASTVPGAVGVAFDQFRYAEASSRVGTTNPYAEDEGRVLRRAREVLDEPPAPAGLDGAKFDGANHASALAAMINLAGPDDALRAARALVSARGPDVRAGAVQLALTVAERSQRPLPQLVEALVGAVDDPAWSSRERSSALRALYRVSPAEGVLKARSCLDDRDLTLQTRAAWVLVEDDLDANRHELSKLVQRWPEDAPYPAFEVRQALEDEDRPE